MEGSPSIFDLLGSQARLRAPRVHRSPPFIPLGPSGKGGDGPRRLHSPSWNLSQVSPCSSLPSLSPSSSLVRSKWRQGAEKGLGSACTRVLNLVLQQLLVSRGHPFVALCEGASFYGVCEKDETADDERNAEAERQKLGGWAEAARRSARAPALFPHRRAPRISILTAAVGNNFFPLSVLPRKGLAFPPATGEEKQRCVLE